ncbi:hypothetical protein NX059_005829 [Plenodomus lindquistii]|nr:hypothetical protein NX059_005829 [Plenodomus lindquistii]
MAFAAAAFGRGLIAKPVGAKGGRRGNWLSVTQNEPEDARRKAKTTAGRAQQANNVKTEKNKNSNKQQQVKQRQRRNARRAQWLRCLRVF